MPNIPKNIAVQHKHGKIKSNIAAMLFAVPVLTTGFSDARIQPDSFSPNTVLVLNTPKSNFIQNKFIHKTVNITDKKIEERLRNKYIYNLPKITNH